MAQNTVCASGQGKVAHAELHAAVVRLQPVPKLAHA